jgi:soluble lytic murein transglycosylase-like protein
MASGSPQLDAVAAATRYGLPPDLFLGLIQTESGFDSTAANPASTAYGYTQLLEGTARDLGVNRFDPQQNLDGGARYLAQQYKRFGDYDTALAAYYQGPNAVARDGVSAEGAAYAAKVRGNAPKSLKDYAIAAAGFLSNSPAARGKRQAIPLAASNHGSPTAVSFSALQFRCWRLSSLQPPFFSHARAEQLL